MSIAASSCIGLGGVEGAELKNSKMKKMLRGDLFSHSNNRDEKFEAASFKPTTERLDALACNGRTGDLEPCREEEKKN